MKQWDEVYRELLDGQNSVTEAVAATKTLVVSLLARAEAAEAEAREAWFAFDRMQDRGNRLAADLESAQARVSELEAAARWHRGTAKPPGPAWYFVYDLREDDTPLRRYHNGAAWGLPGEEEEPPDWWLPIPPLPQETTP